MKTFFQRLGEAMLEAMRLDCGCLFDGATGWVVLPCELHADYCTCAGVPPTMPTYRDRSKHMRGCPKFEAKE